MLTLNILKKLYLELIDFLIDIKNFFVTIGASIHQFLNRFMSDDVILVFLIAISAFVAILVFRAIINKR